MKRIMSFTIMTIIAAALVAKPTPSMSFRSETQNEKMAIGGILSMGIAMGIGDGYAEYMDVNPTWKTPRFAAGGGAYFNYYFAPWFGLHVGLVFVGKGTRYNGDILNESWHTRLALVYLELPFALKFNIDRRFQITAGGALWVAVFGKATTVAGDVEVEDDFEESDWDSYHRANIGPKVSLAYSIPLGPINLVPGATWMFHTVNDLDNDEIPGKDDHQLRMMNVMIDVGVEWFFL